MSLIMYKKKTKVIPANVKKHPITIEDDLHKKIKDISIITRTPMTDIIDSFIRYALDNLEIKEED